MSTNPTENIVHCGPEANKIEQNFASSLAAICRPCSVQCTFLFVWLFYFDPTAVSDQRSHDATNLSSNIRLRFVVRWKKWISLLCCHLPMLLFRWRSSARCWLHSCIVKRKTRAKSTTNSGWPVIGATKRDANFFSIELNLLSRMFYVLLFCSLGDRFACISANVTLVDVIFIRAYISLSWLIAMVIGKWLLLANFLSLVSLQKQSPSRRVISFGDIQLLSLTTLSTLKTAWGVLLWPNCLQL